MSSGAAAALAMASGAAAELTVASGAAAEQLLGEPAGASAGEAAGSAAPSPAETALAYLSSLGEASAGELKQLEDQEKALVLQKKLLKKEIKNKKSRDNRLMSKCAKSLTSSQMLELASKKMTMEKAKAASAAKSKAKAKAKAKASA